MSPQTTNIVSDSVRRFAKSCSANIAITTSLVVLPLMLGAGLSVEYTQLSWHKSASQNSLDEATLAAAHHFMEHQDIDGANAEGKNFYKANCLQSGCDESLDPIFEIVEGESVFGSVGGTMKASFGRLAGYESFNYQNSAKVGVRSKFMEYHFVVNISESMSNASGAEDVRRLREVTQPFVGNKPEFESPEGCAFACHELAGWEPYEAKDGTLVERPPSRNAKPLTGIDIARKYGIKIRADVLREQMFDAFDTILSNVKGTHSDQIKAAIYVFSDKSERLIKPTAVSGNLKAAFAENKIKIRRGDTKYSAVFPNIAKQIGQSGTGNSKDDRMKVVIILTDGLTDYISGPGEVIHALKPERCDVFKQLGAKVMVLHIPYPDLPANALWRRKVKPHVGNIAGNLSKCATDGHYYQSGDDVQIAAKLQKMSKDARESALALIE